MVTGYPCKVSIWKKKNCTFHRELKYLLESPSKPAFGFGQTINWKLENLLFLGSVLIDLLFWGCFYDSLWIFDFGYFCDCLFVHYSGVLQMIWYCLNLFFEFLIGSYFKIFDFGNLNIHHCCNVLETVVTSIQNFLIINMICVGTKKALILWREVGFWCTHWSATSECQHAKLL